MKLNKQIAHQNNGHNHWKAQTHICNGFDHKSETKLMKEKHNTCLSIFHKISHCKLIKYHGFHHKRPTISTSNKVLQHLECSHRGIP